MCAYWELKVKSKFAIEVPFQANLALRVTTDLEDNIQRLIHLEACGRLGRRLGAAHLRIANILLSGIGGSGG